VGLYFFPSCKNIIKLNNILQGRYFSVSIRIGLNIERVQKGIPAIRTDPYRTSIGFGT